MYMCTCILLYGKYILMHPTCGSACVWHVGGYICPVASWYMALLYRPQEGLILGKSRRHHIVIPLDRIAAVLACL